MNEYNEFAKTHGIKKEFWEEGLQFRYQNKSLREYSASVYGLPFQSFPVTAFTSEAVYLQWCIQVSGMMPLSRGKEFKQYMRDRLAEAVEEEIPPNTEEGIEVGIVVLRLLYNEIRRCRNFDDTQEYPQPRFNTHTLTNLSHMPMHTYFSAYLPFPAQGSGPKFLAGILIDLGANTSKFFTKSIGST